MNRIFDRISREPVLGFGAIGLAITAWWSSAVNTEAKQAAVTGILLWLQRTFTTSRKTADENVEGAKYVGAVEHQAITTAAQVIAAATPTESSTSGAVTQPPP